MFNLWATALTVTFIEKKFQSQKDEWELLTEKAIKWMKKTSKEFQLEESVLLNSASNIIL